MSRQKILVATDLSEKSTIAVDKAIAFAKKYDKWLEVLHVINPPIFEWVWGSEELEENKEREELRSQKSKMISEKIKDSLHRRHDKINVDTRVGTPSEQIILYANEHNVSEIILGDTGEHHPLKNFVLGTTAKNVIEQTHIPVLMVRSGDKIDYNKILVPTDMSSESREAIEHVSSLFPDATIHLLHILEVPSEFRMKYYGLSEKEIEMVTQTQKTKGKTQMESFLSTLNIPNKVEYMFAEGSLSAEIILDEGERMDADLIALNAHEINGLTSRIIGSLSNDILENSKLDCLIYQRK